MSSRCPPRPCSDTRRWPAAPLQVSIVASLTILTIAAPERDLRAEDRMSGIELTPIGGYRYGGTIRVEGADSSWNVADSSSFGLIVNLPHDTNTRYEFAYFEQSSEAELDGVTIGRSIVDIEQKTLQIGGRYQWPGEAVYPYLSATIGGTRVEAAGERDTFFSGSVGLGLLISPTSRVGVRVEARAHGVFVNSKTDLLCRTGPDLNVCFIRVEGDMLSQIETFAGFVVRF